MKTIDKLKIIDTIPKEGAIIENLGKQSIKITHLCGCWFVQHFFCGQVYKNKIMPQEKREILQAERSFFVELCEKHK